ncbi:MAG: Cof-type HAD-IIB family hydrolase [Actinomycetaceae bacterium]|nr:Cof-type HAD-IIB family hydrolase [Actinomycetaceae bacterium]
MGSLVFIDVDGTLLNEEQTVPASARDACQAAAANGHSLFMCTGRVGPELSASLWELGFAGLVAANGAYATCGDSTLFSHQLDANDIRRVTDFVTAAGGEWMWQTADTIHLTDAYMRAFADSHTGAEHAIPGDWSSYVDLITPFVRQGLPATALKCAFMLPKTPSATADRVSAALDDRYTIVSGSVGARNAAVFELVAHNVSKGHALREVAAHREIGITKTVAVGDSANDVSMLKAAGLSIAMGNGTEVAQEAADWITSSVDEDGLAHALEYAKLI